MKQLLQGFTPKVCWQQNCKKLCNIRRKFNNRPNKEPNSSSSDHSRGGNWFKTWNLVLEHCHSHPTYSLASVSKPPMSWIWLPVLTLHFQTCFYILFMGNRTPTSLPPLTGTSALPLAKVHSSASGSYNSMESVTAPPSPSPPATSTRPSSN